MGESLTKNRAYLFDSTIQNFKSGAPWQIGGFCILKNCQKRRAASSEQFSFSTVASESQDLNKTLESEHFSAAEQHLRWRQIREPTL
jgi:hypothetical protein